MRLPELQRTLKQGGAQVFVQPLRGVIDGFHLRPDDHLGDADISARKILPKNIRLAVTLLKSQKSVSIAADPVSETKRVKNAASGLRRVPTIKTPPLSLSDLNGVRRKLSDYHGKVVLVNFWASWCPPCIEEIPSMQRLYEKMRGKPFEILAVNVGEKKSVIRKFRKELRFEFPVLLDKKGHVYKEWKVYVYPSNFLLDTKGRLRFGAPGGVVWDGPEAISAINKLLEEAK
jgi:thiol-disulfide isomerase/thioredoxin